MKLRQLQCLCAVIDAGFNISRAAIALHATQPAISKQLRQFEEELGVDLLLRQGGRPVAMTEAGERVLGWARRALQCADNVRLVARAEEGEAGGTIALATSHTHANYLLLPVIVAFRQRFPLVRINVQLGSPNQVAELVRDGKAAIGVTHLPEELPKEVLAVPFLTSPRVLVVAPGHPLLKEKKPLTLEALAPHPIILLSSSRRLGARILRKFQQAELDLNVVVQALDVDVIKNYVAAGLGMGIIPAFAFSSAKDRALRARDVAHLFDPSESAVLMRRRSQLPKYVYQFLEQLDSALEYRCMEAHVLEGA
ncbi:LysR substrate-binding domain-containing protein [Variovorax sp. Sphag1AA]|uniref:LysR substrate-binding domain-containing protein n=1 Tax=Variovorax sp. Sphag1AA TaxID=2587027 RepID=UPI001607F8AA|nr:LysR substrate-binding domain-containing protein [Variovorax sp. Sphag1AA]MBB3181140.1 DNA-binding transcriptional LysR family regulator [Variovorax sp. Sphag1AA]